MHKLFATISQTGMAILRMPAKGREPATIFRHPVNEPPAAPRPDACEESLCNRMN